MKLIKRQLTLLHRHKTSERGHLVIAAWHWAWSLTWRWGIFLSPKHCHPVKRFYFMRLNTGIMVGVNNTWIGNIEIKTQYNMPKRKDDKKT